MRSLQGKDGRLQKHQREENRWRRPIRLYANERGSGNFFLILTILMISLFLSLFFFDAFSIFASKRMNQTAADAAALAATKEAVTIYTEALGEHVWTKVDPLSQAVKSKAEERYQACLASITCDKDGKNCTTCPSYDEFWRGVASDWGIPATLRSNLPGNPDFMYMDISLKEAIPYLFNPNASRVYDDRGKFRNIIDEAIRMNEDRLYEAAGEYAKANGAYEVTELKYITQKGGWGWMNRTKAFEIQVEVKRKLTFTLRAAQNMGDPAVNSFSTAGIQMIDTLEESY